MYIFSRLGLAWLGWPDIVAIPVSTGLCAALGILIEISVYRPLRHKGSSSLILLLASLGIYIVLQNIISMIFGDDIKTIRSGIVKEGINILGARITPVQITIIVVSLLLLVSCFLFLKYTKIGRAMRAVANDSELARVAGIESDKVILLTFALGSALAGIAGILVALDVDITPTMGMNALMMGVVAVIIGGGWQHTWRSPWGIALRNGPTFGRMEDQFTVAGCHCLCYPAGVLIIQTAGFYRKENQKNYHLT